MLAILTVLTAAQLFFKGSFFSLIEPFVGKVSFVISISIATMLPGIIYKGGEWYAKLFHGEHFRTREKAFLIFLIQIAIAVTLAILAQSFIVQLFPQYIKYVWILIAEWFLLLYVWFTRIKHFSFPWFYVIATNIILAVFAYVTYRYV